MLPVKKDIPIGIQNHGNTCFVNATLQSLANCDHLYEAFQTEYLRVHQLATAQQHPTPTMGCIQSLTKPCLLCLLEKAMIMIRSPQNASSVSYIVKSLIDAFPLFPMNLFTKGRQEDCHEFIVNILFAFQLQLGELALTESVVLPIPSAPSSSSTVTDNDPYVHHPSLETLFHGTVQQEIQCQKCLNSSIRHESMIDMAVDIQSSSTLETSIQDYFQVVEFQGNNCYDCSVCQMKTEARQSLQLTSFPKILCIQLKRFFLQGSELKKIKHFVSFPLEFYFPSSFNDDEYNPSKVAKNDSNSHANGKKGGKKRKFFQHLRKQAERGKGGEGWPGEFEYYALKAIIVHRGETINNGHYVSYLRRNGNQWYLADDEKVTAVSVDEVLQAHAYILFYEKEISPYTFANKIKSIDIFKKEIESVAPITNGRSSDLSTTFSSTGGIDHPGFSASSGLLRTVSSKFNFLEKLNLWKSKIQEKERLGALKTLQSRQHHQQQAISSTSDHQSQINIQQEVSGVDTFDDVVDLTGFQDQVIFDHSPLPSLNQFDNDVRLSILSPPPRRASIITESMSAASKSSVSREMMQEEDTVEEEDDLVTAPFSPHITQRRGGKRRRDTYNNELDQRLEEFEKKKQFDFISSPNKVHKSPPLSSPSLSQDAVEDDIQDIAESPIKRQRIENDQNALLSFPLTVVKGISKLFDFRKSKKDKEKKKRTAEKNLIGPDDKVVDLTKSDESSKDTHKLSSKDEGGSLWEEGKNQLIKSIQSVLFEEELLSSPSQNTIANTSMSEVSPSNLTWY